MAFDAADAYARFMGRFSEPLSGKLLDFAGVTAGGRALDVGCGPGVLTAHLVERLGPDSVAAIDLSAPFVVAARERCPGVDIREGAAEKLPYEDASYDVAISQLVVHFMADPVQGLREMGRVVRDGGVVAACVWNHGASQGPISTFWQAVKDLHPGAVDEGQLPGAMEGDLAALSAQAGLRDIEEGRLTVTVPYASFGEWWEPYTLGVGPAGDYVRGLDDAAREALRGRCAELLGPGPFEVSATAWAVKAAP